MRYSTSFAHLGEGILEVRLCGERSPFEGEVAQEAVEAWEFVFEQAREHDIRRVLAIFDLEGTTTAVINVFVARRLKQLGLGRALCVALVDRNLSSRAANEFGCKVAAGHGLGFKSFADVDSAKDWLRASEA